MRPIAEMPVQYTELWEKAVGVADAYDREREAKSNAAREAAAEGIREAYARLTGFTMTEVRVVSAGPAPDSLTIEFEVPARRRGALTIRATSERVFTGACDGGRVQFEWAVARTRPGRWLRTLEWGLLHSVEGRRRIEPPEPLEWTKFPRLVNLGMILNEEEKPTRFEIPDRWRFQGKLLTWNWGSGDHEIN